MLLTVLVCDYLLNDEKVVGETDSNDSDPLLFAKHGTHTETKAEGEPEGTTQTCKKKYHMSVSFTLRTAYVHMYCIHVYNNMADTIARHNIFTLTKHGLNLMHG